MEKIAFLADRWSTPSPGPKFSLDMLPNFAGVFNISTQNYLFPPPILPYRNKKKIHMVTAPMEASVYYIPLEANNRLRLII